MADHVTTEGPEHGHTFRITHESRGAYRVLESGEGPKDAPHWMGPAHVVEVRAWSLRDALRKAAGLPFDVLMGTEAGLDTDAARLALTDPNATTPRLPGEHLVDWQLRALRAALAPHRRLTDD